MLLPLLHSEENGVTGETKDIFVPVFALALAYMLLQALNEGTSSDATFSGAWDTATHATITCLLHLHSKDLIIIDLFCGGIDVRVRGLWRHTLLRYGFHLKWRPFFPLILRFFALITETVMT
jgi:hypothetical protein